MTTEQLIIGFANAALYTTSHESVTDKVFHGLHTFSDSAIAIIEDIIADFETECDIADIDLLQYSEKMIGITLFFTMCGSSVAGFDSVPQFAYDAKEFMTVVSNMKINSLSRNAVFKDNDLFCINVHE